MCHTRLVQDVKASEPCKLLHLVACNASDEAWGSIPCDLVMNIIPACRHMHVKHSFN